MTTANIGESTIFELADRLHELKEKKDELKELTKKINQEYDQVEKALVEEMLAQDVPNFKRNGYHFISYAKTWASPNKEHKEDVYQWLKENGYADIVKETVNANTFSSLINEMIEEEGDIPDDLTNMINVIEKPGVRIRKG